MHITVFLGAKFGKNSVYQERITELADWIGRSGHTLVYGGSKEGLMGILADTALKAGGEVIGIEPQFFFESAVQHEGLTQLIVTKDMAEQNEERSEYVTDFFNRIPAELSQHDKCYCLLYTSDAADE